MDKNQTKCLSIDQIFRPRNNFKSKKESQQVSLFFDPTSLKVWHKIRIPYHHIFKATAKRGKEKWNGRNGK